MCAFHGFVGRHGNLPLILNFAVNIDDGKAKNEAARAQKADPKEDTKGKRKDSSEKATDDYHYERFKKQFRRF